MLIIQANSPVRKFCHIAIFLTAKEMAGHQIETGHTHTVHFLIFVQAEKE